MLDRLPHAARLVGEGLIAVLGLSAAAVSVIGGEGGVLSFIASGVVLATESSVVVGLIGFAGVVFSSVTGILVTLLRAEGTQRGQVLDAIKDSIDTLSGAVAKDRERAETRHDLAVAEIHALDLRLTSLEAHPHPPKGTS